MAVARVTLVCPVCGKEFEAERKCMNRKQADSWEEWAKDSGMVCSDCYRAQKHASVAEKAAEMVARFNLPEINGVSEKQIKYANDLRNKFLANEVTLEKADLYAEAIEKAAEMVDAKIAPRKIGSKLLILMYTTDARTVIDVINDKLVDREMQTLVDAAHDTLVAEHAEEVAKAEAETEDDSNDNNAETEATATETKTATYDKGAIMRSAWAKYKADGNKAFGECLKAAWAEAKIAAGVDPTTTKRTAAKKHTETSTAKATRRTNKAASAVYAC